MNHKRALVSAAFCAALASAAHADTLTYTGIEIGQGIIDDIDLFGQTATVSIEFAPGLTASNGVYKLGTIISATYEFSEAGLFKVDTPEEDLEFGSVNDFELSFFDPDLIPLGMLSGTTAGNIGLDPLEGESLPQLFSRLGDGSSISFTQSDSFQMLNPVIGGLNGGESEVMLGIVGVPGSEVTLTFVPSPGATAVMTVALLGVTRRRR